MLRMSGISADIALADEGRHHLPGKSRELPFEDAGGRALTPVQHDLLEPGIVAFPLLQAGDDVLGRSDQPGLLVDAFAERRHAGRRAGRSPGSALLVGVADEPEGSEPLIALVVGGLDLAEGLCLGVGEVKAEPATEILPELELAAGPGGGLAVGLGDLAEDLLAVEIDHALDAARGDV